MPAPATFVADEKPASFVADAAPSTFVPDSSPDSFVPDAPNEVSSLAPRFDMDGFGQTPPAPPTSVDLAALDPERQPFTSEQATELDRAAWQTYQQPSVSVPKMSIAPTDSKTMAAGKEVVNIAAGIPEFFSSPLGVTAIAGGMVAPTAVAGLFTADMLHSVGKQATESGKNWDAMTPAQKSVAVTDMIGTGAFATLTGKATIKGARAGASAIKERMVPGSVEMPKLETQPEAQQRAALIERTSKPGFATVNEAIGAKLDEIKALLNPSEPTSTELRPPEEGQPVSAPAPADTGASPSKIEPWQMKKAEGYRWVDENMVNAVKTDKGRIIAKNMEHGDLMPMLEESGSTFNNPNARGWALIGKKASESYIGIQDVQAANGDFHKAYVMKALREGKSVPSEVLADYPDLQTAQKPLPTPTQPDIFPTADAGAETITGSNEQKGSEMPAERPTRPNPRPASDRPWDLIDELEANLGGKLSLRKARELIADFKPTGRLRKLFRQEGYAPDIAAQSVSHVQSFGSDAEFLEALQQAAEARKGDHAAANQEGQIIRSEQKKLEQFTSKVIEGQRPKAEQANVERVPVHDLYEGDVFQVQGHEFKVTNQTFDEDGRLESLELDDGPKFGVQTVTPDQAEFIHMDKGTFEPAERSASFAPKEDLTLGKPETIEEQKARLASEDQSRQSKQTEEARQAAEATKVREMRERATKRIGGDLGSAGQGKLFAEPGQQEIFAPKPAEGMAGPGSPHVSEIPESGMGKEIYGVAERVREERAKAGQVAEVPPGEGISAKESVEHGQELLKKGGDAEKAMSEFEKTKAVSSDAMALTRAHGENLARIARRTEEQFGTDSNEFRKAFDDLSAWDKRTKAMQTEWHKSGMAQQGETDIDTGSFTGLQRAYKESSGKDFTPSQAARAKQTAKRVSSVEKATEVAKTKLTEELGSQGQSPTDAANRTVREAAARLAKAEKRGAEIDAERDAAVRKIQDDAEARARAAASKTVREAAIRAAKKSEADAIARAAKEKKFAEVERRTAQKALDEANRKVREAAIKGSQQEQRAAADPQRHIWEKVREYIEKGEDDFDDIRNKIATDLGMPVKKVTDWMTQNRRAKYLADDLWRKQQAYRRMREQAKRWLQQTQLPGYQRALSSIPRIMFGLKVGFHGTVALGTHAPMVAFQPRFWTNYVRDFGRMYRMVGRPTFKGQSSASAYYEMQVQDLLRRPNYTTARRAGLVNDPFTYEELAVNPMVGKLATIAPKIAEWFNKITGMGNRGYSVLKILRQDMFDQHWNKLPKTAQIPEMAKAIADATNHATGVVKGAAPKGANVALFAPRLLASRVMWLAADPAKAVDTFARWKVATDAEKYFAVNQVKEKAWVAGTMFGLLAFNQGVLNAVNSDQKINFDDPFHSDWLKFKAGGMTGSYGNAMITMARLPIRLYQIRTSDGGKLKNVIYPDESSYTVMGEYARSQMSPFASLATTLWLKGDWQNRPLPSSDRPVPKRLKAQGVKPYTWTEFWVEQMLPIPAEEAAREVWQHGMGMDTEQIAAMRKALATIAIMSGTGARLTDDIPYKKK